MVSDESTISFTYLKESLPLVSQSVSLLGPAIQPLRTFVPEVLIFSLPYYHYSSRLLSNSSKDSAFFLINFIGSKIYS